MAAGSTEGMAPVLVFVTVGNPTQPFDRLIRWADEIAAKRREALRFFVQRGASHIEPAHCEWTDFVEMERFDALSHEAQIVITHGGQGSILASLQAGKKPIVVPRLARFKEHVNDHQMEIVREFTRKHLIFPVTTQAELERALDACLGGGNRYAYRPNNRRMMGLVSSYLRQVEAELDKEAQPSRGVKAR